MKKVAVLISIVFLSIQIGAMSIATTSADVELGIKKYKEGNYTGCIETMSNLIESDPSNAVAYYYLAMAYVQAGREMEAIENYSKVISLNTNPLLTEYASHGKLCLEDPVQCQAVLNESDKFIESPYNTGLSKILQSDLEKREIDFIRKEMNRGKEIDPTKFQEYRDFSSSKDVGNPSNDEIVAALRVLQRAGLSQSFASPFPNNNVSPMNDINAFLSQNSNNAGNNAIMNMLPYLNNGNNGQQINPQLIQTMLMNQMIPSFSDNNDRR